MTKVYDMEIKLYGAGRNRFGLWVLGLVTKIFDISIEIEVISKDDPQE